MPCKRVAADDRQRCVPVVRRDVSAHPPQRLGDALHRPCAQRVVAGQDEASLLPRQHAGKEADQGAGVRAVDGVVRRAQSPKADTVDEELVVAELLHLDAERTHRVHGRHRVVRPAEALNVGRPLGDAAEHDGPVRDRLVAGHGDVTDDCDGGVDLHLSLSRSCVP